ncbi:hypothetical protein [Actinoplanes sp. NPDC049802]|uniref:hypothetical protein n=1 Tax=Actinoplanes sp. NPDC049802 TaxID=3154742 RepID=UPI0033DC7E7D
MTIISTPGLHGGPPATGLRRPVLPAAAVAALGAGIALTALLGPLVSDLMRYRTSPTTLNQLLGSDAAGLFVIAPLAVVAAVLVFRRPVAGLLLASGIGAFAVYTYLQVIVGQEYLRLPGNVERFFPLLLAVFVLAEATFVLAWRAVPTDLPPVSRRLELAAGGALLAVVVFLVFGQHLRPMLLAWSDPASLTEYASSPTPFWLVKLMDLGIVVPIAAITGIGLLRRAAWARRVAYPLLTAYALLGVSVTAMGVVMSLHADPDAAPGLTVGFLVFTAIFAGLAAALYRPLLRRPTADPGERHASG